MYNNIALQNGIPSEENPYLFNGDFVGKFYRWRGT